VTERVLAGESHRKQPLFRRDAERDALNAGASVEIGGS
jgi:hypothetical protein